MAKYLIKREGHSFFANSPEDSYDELWSVEHRYTFRAVRTVLLGCPVCGKGGRMSRGIVEVDAGFTLVMSTHGERDGHLTMDCCGQHIHPSLMVAHVGDDIKMVACTPARVIARYPEYKDYILGDWDNVTVHHVTLSPGFDTIIEVYEAEEIK